MNGIINLFANIQVNTNNHTGLEATTLSKYFEAYYIGKKGRTNKDIENYLDISEIEDINVFENIFYNCVNLISLVELYQKILLKKLKRWHILLEIYLLYVMIQE